MNDDFNSVSSKAAGREAEGASENVSIAVPKKRGGRFAIAGIAAVVVVLAFGLMFKVGVFAFGSSYQKAETKFLSALSGEYKGAAKTAADFDVTYHMSDALKTFGPSLGLPENMGDISVGGNIVSDGVKSFMSFYFSDGVDKIDGVELYTDGNSYTLAAPKWLSYYFTMSMSDINGGNSTNYDVSKLDEKALNKTLKNLADEYFSIFAKHAAVDKKAELTGGGLTVKCEEYSVVFSERMVEEYAIFAVNELKANRNLIDFVDSCMAGSYPDGSDSIDAMLDEAVAEINGQLDALDGDGADLFRLTAWVKGDEIVGRRIDKIMDADGVSAAYKSLASGGSKYVEFSVLSDDAALFAYGDMKKNGSVWDGTFNFDVTAGGETYSIPAKVTGWGKDGDKRVGTVTLEGDIDAGGQSIGYNLSLVFSKDGNRQVVALSGEVAGISIGKLTMSGETRDASEVASPNYAGLTAVGYAALEQGDISDDIIDGVYDDLDKMSEGLHDGIIGQLIEQVKDSLYWLNYDWDSYDWD